MDNDSHISFITEELVSKIHGSPFHRNLDISGISGNNIFTNFMTDVVIIPILKINNRFHVTCAILQEITCKLPQTLINLSDLETLDGMLINLADPDFFHSIRD